MPSLQSLPNEILLSILAVYPENCFPGFRATCRRFLELHDAAVSIRTRQILLKIPCNWPQLSSPEREPSKDALRTLMHNAQMSDTEARRCSIRIDMGDSQTDAQKAPLEFLVQDVLFAQNWASVRDLSVVVENATHIKAGVTLAFRTYRWGPDSVFRNLQSLTIVTNPAASLDTGYSQTLITVLRRMSYQRTLQDFHLENLAMTLSSSEWRRAMRSLCSFRNVALLNLAFRTEAPRLIQCQPRRVTVDLMNIAMCGNTVLETLNLKGTCVNSSSNPDVGWVFSLAKLYTLGHIPNKLREITFPGGGRASSETGGGELVVHEPFEVVERNWGRSGSHQRLERHVFRKGAKINMEELFPAESE